VAVTEDKWLPWIVVRLSPVGDLVTGISGSKVMICICNSGSNPERTPCR